MKLAFYAFLAVVCLGAVGVVVHAYGNARYEAGILTATKECIEAVDRAIEKAKKERAKVDERVAKMSDPDLDAALSRWMRAAD